MDLTVAVMQMEKLEHSNDLAATQELKAQEADAARAAAQAELALLESELASANANAGKLQREIEMLEQKLCLVQKSSAEGRADLEHQTEAERLRAEAVEAELKYLRDEHAMQTGELETCRNQMSECSIERSEAQAKVESLMDDITLHNLEIEQLGRTVKQLKQERDDALAASVSSKEELTVASPTNKSHFTLWKLTHVGLIRHSGKSFISRLHTTTSNRRNWRYIASWNLNVFSLWTLCRKS